MASKVEFGFGALALACFAGAANAWMGNGQGTHATLFLAAGIAAVGLGLSWSEVPRVLHGATMAGPDGKGRRRLIAALVYVARCCKDARPADVADVYRGVTGEDLPQGEIAKAANYLRSRHAAPIEKILGRIEDEDEKRRVLSAVCEIWSRHGLDSEKATRAVERVAAALGLEGNDINAALDAPWTAEASRLLKNVETLARRTVSRATTGAQRITTRLRGIG